jgi:hypothetical protein
MHLTHEEMVDFLRRIHTQRGGTGAILNLIRGAKVRAAADLSLLTDIVADTRVKLELSRHAADETRHACLLLERMAQLGVRAYRVPPQLDRIEGLFDSTRARDVRLVYSHRGVVNEAELMELTVAAYVAKTDSLRRLRANVEALDHDEPTRELVRTILSDEVGHVGFLAHWLERFEARFSCKAVARARERLEAVLTELDTRFHAALREHFERVAA